MKKLLFGTTLFLGLSGVSLTHAQSTKDIDELKARKEVLKLNTKLNNDKIKLEKEKKDYDKLVNNADDANDKAERKGAKFSGTSNAERTAKEAKEATKKMKDAEKANKDLANKKSRIANLEKDIKKTEDKIDKLNDQIEFTDKNRKNNSAKEEYSED